MQTANFREFLQKATGVKQLGIALKNDEERAALLQFLAKRFFPNAEKAGEDFAPSLFATEQYAIFNPIPKKVFPSDLILLLGSKSVSAFKAYPDALVLNLEKETFRAREERYKEFVMLELGEISSSAAALFITYVGCDFNLISQEIDKLRMVSQKPIDEKIIQDLVPNREDTALWKVSEELVFERKIPQIPLFQTRELLILIGQMRSHLETGLKIKELEGKPLAPHFPKLQSWILDRYARLSAKIPPRYFQKGLSELLDLEIKSKSTTIDPKVLLDHFMVRWQVN